MNFLFKRITIVAVLIVTLSATVQAQMPKLVITSITNNTLFDLLFIDRLKWWSYLTLPAGQTITPFFQITGFQNVVIDNNINAIMAQNAQFVIRKLDASGNQEKDKQSYVNICMVPGGVNDGSNFITGTPGSMVFKFLMANKTGGFNMSSRRLQDSNCTIVEVALEVNAKESDIGNDEFKLSVTCKHTEK